MPGDREKSLASGRQRLRDQAGRRQRPHRLRPRSWLHRDDRARACRDPADGDDRRASPGATGTDEHRREAAAGRSAPRSTVAHQDSADLPRRPRWAGSPPRSERLRREVQEAQAAADGRALIELAKGILVERLRLRARPGRPAARRACREQAGASTLELAVDIINQAARDRCQRGRRRLPRPRDRYCRRADEAASHRAVRLRTAESGVLAAADTQAVAESLLKHALGPARRGWPSPSGPRRPTAP